MKYAKERETLKARYASLTLSNSLMQVYMINNASCLEYETHSAGKESEWTK